MSKNLAVAVHVISESSDHYNLLIYVDIDDKANIKSQLEDNIIEGAAWWSDYFVSTNIPEYDRKIKDVIRELIDEAQLKDEEYE